MSESHQICHFSYDGIELTIALDPRERIISSELARSHTWEANQLQLYPDLISAFGTFVDVGANVGINSLYVKRRLPHVRVIAIEPQPNNFALLEHNANAAGVRIECIPQAMSNHAGEAPFRGEGTNARLDVTRPTAAGTSQMVSCETLDSLFLQLQLGLVDLMKIDVEGYTDLVLEGGTRAISQCRSVIVEFSHGDMASRLGVSEVTDPPISSVQREATRLLEILHPHFRHLFLLSRRGWLVHLRNPGDLFDVMFCESTVGDILATNARLCDALTINQFVMRTLLELKQQNHRRLVDIRALQDRLNGQGGNGG